MGLTLGKVKGEEKIDTWRERAELYEGQLVICITDGIFGSRKELPLPCFLRWLRQRDRGLLGWAERILNADSAG